MKKYLLAPALALAAVVAIAPVASASAATTKHKVPAVRCHLEVKHGKKYVKTWTKCPKASSAASSVAGVNGRDGKDGAPGLVGPAGPRGLSGLEGAFYAIAKYDVGDTNAGAIATVACDPNNSNYTAIAGGVQTVGTKDTNDYNTPVASSFPGRMDWSTNKPKQGRLDGWIVQFGGNAGAQSDKAPEKVNVWALCVPRTDIPVRVTFQQSA
jgi:hypothetical protein